LTFGSRPTPEFADLTVQDCLALTAETRISLNFRSHYALMPSGFVNKSLECVDDFMRVFCDVDVREDSSDLPFFVNNECHSLRV
jgi:hypothetical protein